MIDCKKAMARAREVARGRAESEWPPAMPNERRARFEQAVVREFADLVLSGGYESLVHYPGEAKR